MSEEWCQRVLARSIRMVEEYPGRLDAEQYVEATSHGQNNNVKLIGSSKTGTPCHSTMSHITNTRTNASLQSYNSK
jgi:hypothetical protein